MFLRTLSHIDCVREGAQFTGNINNNQERANTTENIFIGISKKVSGKN